MIYNNIYELIGRTPVVKLEENEVTVYAKLEFFNPAGSVKDRIAKSMIEALSIEEGTTIVEATSGNTGIAIAMTCAAKKIKCVIVMPETMSIERRKIIKAYGAEIILTEGAKGMRGALERAKELVESKGYTMLSQFINAANVEAHKNTTATEIIEDFDTLDYFVAGIGTGGTITGNGEVLKKHYADIKIIGIEPDTSAVLTTGTPGAHKIQGIGAGFKPEILNLDVVDEIKTIAYDDAVSFARKLATQYGILAGFSGGANYKIAYDIAKKAGKNKKVLFVVPDNGERYLSTPLYEV
ncbi:MAG: cysteine synthase A [Epulopiscium sp. Nuni2H_MBin003]|nr:MAG: cysteine synthase A [Epulopiscium sp. Nuni2H_MBin003]